MIHGFASASGIKFRLLTQLIFLIKALAFPGYLTITKAIREMFWRLPIMSQITVRLFARSTLVNIETIIELEADLVVVSVVYCTLPTS